MIELRVVLPVQLGVRGLIDLAHAPLANEGGDMVVAESGADVESNDLLLDRNGLPDYKGMSARCRGERRPMRELEE